MNAAEQSQLASEFRAIHNAPPLLLLPNAWDPISARLFEAAGFKAVATTSGGLAWALGYQDGEHAPWPEVVAATRRIARVVNVPVSADIEMGYGEAPQDVERNVAEIIGAGAVGINIEDGLPTASERIRTTQGAAERIRAARRAADAAGVPIVINARTDVYHLNIGDERDRFSDVVQRAEAYVDAGADCVFVFGHVDIEIAGKLAAAIKAPINIVGRPGMPSAQALERIGIARVSTASGPSMAIMEATRDLARSLFEKRTFDVFASSLRRPEVQALFSNTTE